MSAFARLQFEEMTEYEREAIKGGLKKYCELDTMAMVMIYEARGGLAAIRVQQGVGLLWRQPQRSLFFPAPPAFNPFIRE